MLHHPSWRHYSSAQYDSPRRKVRPSSGIALAIADILIGNSRLCIYYHVGGRCRHESKCSFRHDDMPSAEDLYQLHVDAKNIPCFQLNSGKLFVLFIFPVVILSLDKTCLEGDACSWAHFCPRGTRCKFYKQGVCKFKGGK
jgi:hypothetical protein